LVLQRWNDTVVVIAVARTLVSRVHLPNE